MQTKTFILDAINHLTALIHNKWIPANTDAHYATLKQNGKMNFNMSSNSNWNQLSSIIMHQVTMLLCNCYLLNLTSLCQVLRCIFESHANNADQNYTLPNYMFINQHLWTECFMISLWISNSLRCLAACLCCVWVSVLLRACPGVLHGHSRRFP